MTPPTEPPTVDAANEPLFGTDGIRGRAGDGVLTAAHVSAIGRAIGEVLAPDARQRAEPPRALLGHDGRRSGPELEAALARGLTSAGCEVTSAGLIPTPGLALLGRKHGFALSVMVSASHNPAEDNGIKVFRGNGGKLSDADERAIEARFRAAPEAVLDGPLPRNDPGLERSYLDHLLEAAGDLRLDAMPIVVDCANGGGCRIAPRVLGRLGAQVTAIADAPDGDNINRDCGATHLALLQQEVRRSEARLGIALDGDGDRCMLVDERGEIVDGDGIMTVVARHAMATDALPDPRIVATVMSNRGLHRALREQGIAVVTVSVGDRQVVEALQREGLSMGGEQSGHVVFGPENHHIGDGIYTALRVLQVMVETGLSLSELARPFQSFPQVLQNVRVNDKTSTR